MPKVKKKPQRAAEVTLKIAGKTYKSKSSTQYGHAEMAALYKFVQEMKRADKAPGEVLKATRGTQKTVTCPNQPVCASCTIVLQALGFKLAAGTKYSKKKSGGVSWGASKDVKDMLKAMGLGAALSKAMNEGAM